MPHSVREFDSYFHRIVGLERYEEWPTASPWHVTPILLSAKRRHLDRKAGMRTAHRSTDEPNFSRRECNPQ
jgi:hypothetical protein